jgi:hypothetical protein
MIRIFFILVCGLIAHAANADIYKCTGPNGNLIFSQKPCGANAETVVIKDTTSGVSITGDGDFSQVDADRRTRDIDRAIDRHYRTIGELQRERDAKVADIRHQQSRAANNLAGATYLQSLATEMQAINDDYNTRINMERDAIRSLNEQR